MDLNGRHELLQDRLREHGVTLREDSRLCAGYVFFGKGDPESIARTMAEMEFFHHHTDYKRAVNVIRREKAPYVKDRDTLSLMAKKRALRWLIRSGDDRIAAAPLTLGPMIAEAYDSVHKHG